MARIAREQYSSVIEAVLGHPDAQNLLLDLRDNALASVNAFVPTAADPNCFGLHRGTGRVDMLTYLINLGMEAREKNNKKSQQPKP